MRRPRKLFQIDTYIDPNESFHFSRKDLTTTSPSFNHHHDYFELMLVEQGEIYHWINGVEERLEQGHLVFLRPHDSHSLQADIGTGARILNIMFRTESAAHLVRRYSEDLENRFFWAIGQLPATLRLEGSQRERAINSMLALQNSNRSLARIENFLLSTMTHMLDVAEVIDDRAPAWLLAACQAARDPEYFRQGAEGFAAAAGRSHEHVCRQARRYLGLSPTQYVNRIRIQHSAMLLAATARSLNDVAADCGFENLSYFHRLFREQYGTTPRNYRLRHQRSEPSEGPL